MSTKLLFCMTRHLASRHLQHNNFFVITIMTSLGIKIEWPGNSPDLNPCENFGSIIKDKVESILHIERNLTMEGLRNALNNVLRSLEHDTNIFERLLRSFPDSSSCSHWSSWWPHQLLNSICILDSTCVYVNSRYVLFTYIVHIF